jgi:hypothetical protein
MFKFLSKKQIEKIKKKSFEDGCLKGFKECESQISELLLTQKKRIEKEIRSEYEQELLAREAKGYDQGLKDGKYLK